MKPPSQLRVGPCAAVVSLLCASAALSQPYWFTYEPSLGTLPTDQCWQIYQTGSFATPVVAVGALFTGPTSTPGYQYWYKEFSQPLSFADGVSIEADLEIISSNFNSTSGGSGQRAGYYLSVSDGSGRYASVGIGDSTTYMTCVEPSPNGIFSPSVNFNAVGRHTYRLDVTLAGASLYVDNVQLLTMPLSTQTSTPNLAYFSDGSVYGTHQAKLYHLRTTAPSKPCFSDFNRDCFLDFTDFDAFVSAFEGGLAIADFNEDGFLDFTDFDAFVTAFEAGC